MLFCLQVVGLLHSCTPHVYSLQWRLLKFGLTKPLPFRLALANLLACPAVQLRVSGVGTFVSCAVDVSGRRSIGHYPGHHRFTARGIRVRYNRIRMLRVLEPCWTFPPSDIFPRTFHFLRRTMSLPPRTFSPPGCIFIFWVNRPTQNLTG